MLNPVISMLNRRLAKKPPTIAPAIPRTIAPTIPPLEGLESIALAITPAIKPKTIQPITLIIQQV